MCFTNNDYDWTARETEEEMVKSNGKDVCFDCGRSIPEGEVFRKISMWEFETCGSCEFRHDEDLDFMNDDGLCRDDYGDLILSDRGESDTIKQCQACVKLREAIKEYELGRGCREYNSEPINSLNEEYGGMGPEDFSDYVEYACGKFPEMAEEFRSRFPVTEKE